MGFGQGIKKLLKEPGPRPLVFQLGTLEHQVFQVGMGLKFGQNWTGETPSIGFPIFGY